MIRTPPTIVVGSSGADSGALQEREEMKLVNFLCRIIHYAGKTSLARTDTTLA
jgi:hypothetical protein